MRQVDDRQRRAPAATAADQRRGSGAARRRRRLRDDTATAARRALDVGRHCLPGCPARPQPRAACRRPDRRGDRVALLTRPQRRESPDRPAARASRAGSEPGEVVSPSAVRRPAPARAHRPRPGLRASVADCRRADDGARRDGPGAGSPAARRSATRPGIGDVVHHPRPVAADLDVPSPGDHVCRPDRRGRAERRGVRQRVASVQSGPGPGLSVDRRPRVTDGAEWPARRSAEPRRPAGRMSVRATCDVAVDECQSNDVRLRRSAVGRRAACVHVGTADG